MSSKPSAEKRIAEMNQEVAAYQRAGKVKEGIRLADEAFFSSLKELPEGHFLRAQSARNRGIMQFMDGNNEEALKTLLVALDFYGKTLKATTSRRDELESSGKYQEALEEARQEVQLAEAIRQLQDTLFGKPDK